MSRQKVLMIIIVCLTLVFTKTNAFASLVINSNSITSSNGLTISPGLSSPINVTRQEPTPSAPTAAQVSTGSGNCTAGTHVFAVVFNTFSGHTPASSVSNTVTCDGSHKQVSVTLPQSIGMYVVSRDVYASKADTTSPLYLVSASPVVNWPNVNADLGLTSVYTFNIADASLTSTVAPTANTTNDNVYSISGEGRTMWGYDISPISSSYSNYLHESGSINSFIIQRDDPGEARLSLVSSGQGSGSVSNFPTMQLINSQASNVNGVTTYKGMGSGEYLGVFSVRGSRNTNGDYQPWTATGLQFLTTEQWSNTAQGTRESLTGIITGTAQQYAVFTAESVGGMQIFGTTNNSATHALQVENSDFTKLLTVRDDGLTTLGGNLVTSTDNTYDIGASGATRPRTGYFGTSVVSPAHYYTATVFDSAGTGSPEGAIIAEVGSTYRRTDGGANTSFYVKETGTGNTGWVAK